MNYYLDHEFNVRKINIPGEIDFVHIDLISIGIKAEDGREYYAIHSEFNLEEAWSAYQYGEEGKEGTYWLRENVLAPIFDELARKAGQFEGQFFIGNFRKLLNQFGKTRRAIAQDVLQFVYQSVHTSSSEFPEHVERFLVKGDLPVFYGYFADYDWVLFCSLFGNMKDLPKGFPYYCRDLKQTLDDYADALYTLCTDAAKYHNTDYQETPQKILEEIKAMPDYPVQVSEHHAIADARWNQALHTFLRNYKFPIKAQ